VFEAFQKGEFRGKFGQIRGISAHFARLRIPNCASAHLIARLRISGLRGAQLQAWMGTIKAARHGSPKL
jgi:hypothetical protein